MTTNVQLLEVAERLRLKNFRGVFMRDELKNIKAKKYECDIVNLDSARNEGSHWCCYLKKIR